MSDESLIDEILPLLKDVPVHIDRAWSFVITYFTTRLEADMYRSTSDFENEWRERYPKLASVAKCSCCHRVDNRTAIMIIEPKKKWMKRLDLTII